MGRPILLRVGGQARADLRESDLATAELMKGFYRSMLQQDLPPAAALRAAQLQLSREPRGAPEEREPGPRRRAGGGTPTVCSTPRRVGPAPRPRCRPAPPHFAGSPTSRPTPSG